MKILVAYASKSGTTAKCAKMLAGYLTGADLVDLTKKTPDLDKYDLIVIGGSIRMGYIHKTAGIFINEHQQQLLKKKTGFFFCKGFEEDMDELIKDNLPDEVADKAIIIDSFGGELDIEKQKGIDRFVAKMIIKRVDEQKSPLPRIYTERIKQFAVKLLA